MRKFIFSEGHHGGDSYIFEGDIDTKSNKGRALLLQRTVTLYLVGRDQRWPCLYDASRRADPSYQQMLVLFALPVATVTL